MAIILDGKDYADEICNNLKERVNVLKSKGVKPKLMIVTASSDPASKIYVRNKIKRCDEIGIECEHLVTDKLTIGDMEYVAYKGIPTIVQMPFESDEVKLEDLCNYISEDMDVDGFVSPFNVANLASGIKPINYPCTPLGVVKLLQHYNIPIERNNVVIFGRSNLVGHPLSRMLEHLGATVTICHSKTKLSDKYESFLNADIIISATGCVNTIDYKTALAYGIEDCFLKHQVFIDVGMNRNEDGKLCGDIPLELKEKGYAYTPVPGGVGKMTVAMLMNNVVEYYERG